MKLWGFFASVLPLLRLSAVLDHVGGVRAQKPLKKVYFVDAELVWKTVEIFNLTTSKNVILIKLTTIMYLHESVNQKALRARNSFFWLNFALLVKLLYKLDNIWGSIPLKTIQSRFNRIAMLASLKSVPKLLSLRLM